MKRVRVEASLSYDVLIEKGLLADAGRYIKDIAKGKTAVIISETNVFPLYGDILKNTLIKEGFEVLSFVFPAGEESKNTETLVSLWEFLAENHITRSDTLVALGGGVTGDLTGFAAATFLRGIRYVGIPTTLLSMVDSSVGGKTAVDLKGGKNLAGAFYQPSLVLIDPETLDTLPESIFSDGMAEVIKYGMINLPDFLKKLEENYDISDIIEISVKDKRDIVAVDEKDTGIRQLLNFGHTPAHSVELLSDFTISHGSAVAIGMVIMTKASVKAGLCEESALGILLSLLRKYSLPEELVFSPESIADAALNDKKRSGDTITLVIPEKAGLCTLKKFPVSEVYSFISGAWEK
ncbi:MAG: 3-dehydroquinate synthase [Ruminococcaceae bacterium]|nr:3-dehydroquinate synthase [Oscillospiraceae bacterium]